MPERRGQPGPILPYRPLAGVVPCPGGWLIASGKLQGINVAPDETVVLPRFIDVLDYRPSFEVIALHAPVGLLAEPRPRGRRCDEEARVILGPRRGAAVASAPSRAAVEAGDAAVGLSAVQRALLPRVAEVAAEMQPYRQRAVHEVHAELSFHQLNGDAPMRWGKHTGAGREERAAVLRRRLPGIERVFDRVVAGARPEHLLDACAALWTARRIAARSVERIPEAPEWDDLGLRMQIVR